VPIALLLSHTSVVAWLSNRDSGMGGGRQKTLTYIEITSSDINCALKNSRGGKSKSGKVIKKGI